MTPPDKSKTYHARVYDPIQPSVSIKAVKCFLLIERYSSIAYFFGAQTHEIFHTVMVLISAGRCRRTSSSLVDEWKGKLTKIDPNTYQTNHKLKVHYS